jgi:hypothetical protein
VFNSGKLGPKAKKYFADKNLSNRLEAEIIGDLKKKKSKEGDAIAKIQIKQNLYQRIFRRNPTTSVAIIQNSNQLDLPTKAGLNIYAEASLSPQIFLCSLRNKLPTKDRNFKDIQIYKMVSPKGRTLIEFWFTDIKCHESTNITLRTKVRVDKSVSGGPKHWYFTNTQDVILSQKANWKLKIKLDPNSDYFGLKQKGFERTKQYLKMSISHSFLEVDEDEKYLDQEEDIIVPILPFIVEDQRNRHVLAFDEQFYASQLKVLSVHWNIFLSSYKIFDRFLPKQNIFSNNIAPSKDAYQKKLPKGGLELSTTKAKIKFNDYTNDKFSCNPKQGGFLQYLPDAQETQC